MDWATHVVLATKLLESCGLEKEAAIYSVIPVIDIEPPHFHRVYAHILENFPDFLDVALEIFGSEEAKNKDFASIEVRGKQKVSLYQEEMQSSVDSLRKRGLEKKIYAYQRISQEAKTFILLAEEAKALLGEDVEEISCHKLSAGISLLSHVYFDTWNNPIQLFLPFCSFCSAQWELWNCIDYMKFRGEFYRTENILSFRKEIIRNHVWDMELKPEALIKAIIIRMGEMGQPFILYEIVDMGIRDYMRYLDINEYQRADREIKFCRDLEAEISRIILRDYGKCICSPQSSQRSF